jgi:predicted nucleic acid-binding protein
MLIPAPLVVDADVLIRNVEYAVKKGYAPALLGRASGNYSLFTGVVLFATPQVVEETERHLPDVVARTGNREGVARVWGEMFLPRIRIVPVDLGEIADQRIDGVKALHPNDAPTAALALLLAPAALLTDNRQHFLPFGLAETKTDAVAIDAFAVGELGGGLQAASIVPRVSAMAAVEGSKKLVRALGPELTLIIGLILIGGFAWYLTTEKGQRMRGQLVEFGRTYGPPLMAEVEKRIEAGNRLTAFAVDEPEPPTPLNLIARRLAVRQSSMTSAEIVRELAMHSLSFRGAKNQVTAARAWLARHACFTEGPRGHWSLGFYKAAVPH